jgi:hypothetical protein
MKNVTLLYIALLLSGCMPDYEQLEILEEGYDLKKNVSKKWEKVCFSSQYELPDLSYSVSCWNGNEVPNQSIAITYLHADNTCTLKMISGDFLSPRNSETRCFTFKEVDETNLKLIRSGSVVSFKLKDSKS